MKACAWVMVLTILSACGGGSDAVVVPEDAIGVWVTDDARYAERAFEVTAAEVFFQTGEADYTNHRIRRVETSESGDGLRVELGYRGVSGDRETFRFTVVDPGEVRFENQPLVKWVPAPAHDDRPWQIPT